MATFTLDFADNAAVKKAKTEVGKTTFRDAIKKVQAKAEDATAVEKKVTQDVFETKTQYELVREITKCELTKDKKACASSYGCTFIQEKAAVTAKAYKFNCGVRQKTECAKDGDKKTPTDKEKAEEEKKCKGQQDTAKKCEDLSANCKGTKVEGQDKKEKVEASCVRTPCSAFGQLAAACRLIGCDYAAPTTATGKPTYKCEANKVLTDDKKKKACAAAKSNCGVADNGGTCCSITQSNADYKPATGARCTVKKTTTKKPDGGKKGDGKGTTTDKLSAASSMLASVTTLVAVAMMS